MACSSEFEVFLSYCCFPCETNRERGKWVSDCLPGCLFEELGQTVQRSKASTLYSKERNLPPCFQSRGQMCEENLA